MRNRRSDTRVKAPDKINATITYTDTLSYADGGIVANMSRNGLFLKTDQALAENAYVTMKLNTEGIIGKSLWAQGFVARTDRQGMGIRFTYIDQDILRLLFS
jgi:hypothetical protein